MPTPFPFPYLDPHLVVPPLLHFSPKMKRALIYGANGSLGKSLVSTFLKNSWLVTGLDFTSNTNASSSITLSKTDSNPTETYTKISLQLLEILKNEKLDCIVNVAGGLELLIRMAGWKFVG